jgi:hypothetical protein
LIDWKGPVGKENLLWVVIWTAILVIVILLRDPLLDEKLFPTISFIIILAVLTCLQLLDEMPVWHLVYHDHEIDGIPEAIKAALGDSDWVYTRRGPYRTWFMRGKREFLDLGPVQIAIEEGKYQRRVSVGPLTEDNGDQVESLKGLIEQTLLRPSETS